ncbi:hypothetical protein FGO68_gene10238 [Halteria grandinella]|uniref:Uncharacterized protein n=1 Tax=Halteria grandinella TaxID=5974 RepID=A0A8J8T933_HALGN|nr:hypothetical protein FGO68_gene10238 [Halteria grandinella]
MKALDTQSARKTIKTDMKTVEMYRQNISICSVAAYRQGKQYQSNVEVFHLLKGVEENVKVAQSRAAMLQRPHTAKSNSSPNPKQRNASSTIMQSKALIDPSLKNLSPLKNRETISKLRLQSAINRSEPQNPLQAALKVQLPNTNHQKVPTLKDQLLKEIVQPKSIQQPVYKGLPSAQSLRDKFRNMLTVAGKPIGGASAEGVSKLFYLDFENLFKSLMQQVRNLRCEDNKVKKQLEDELKSISQVSEEGVISEVSEICIRFPIVKGDIFGYSCYTYIFR